MNIGMAVSTFVGQNLGAGRPERVRRGYRAALLMAGSISVATAVVMVVFKEGLIGVFNADPEVMRVGGQYLLIVSLFYVLFSSMFVTGGVLRG